MDDGTGRAVALGVATDVLVAVAARVVVLPVEFLAVAVPLVCGSGVLAGIVSGATLAGDDWPRAGRLGALAGGIGGVALAGSLWAGMALLVPLPDGTPVWGLAYLAATAGPGGGPPSTLVGDPWAALVAGGVVVVHAAGGAVGARLAVRSRGQ